jgi:hypothetical protein
VVEEVELEENLASVEVTEEGVRTGSWFCIFVSTRSMEERAANLFEGLVSLKIDFQAGVEGVDG